MPVRILVTGLGSMGKRRIRNLQTLEQIEIAGFDIRDDRRQEAVGRYGVPVFKTFEDGVREHRAAAVIISVPPDVHHVYMKKAIAMNVPFFVEASVVDTDMSVIVPEVQSKGLYAAPSSTMYFHPAIQKIFELVKGGNLGKLSSIMFHSGQFLPDWHPYEKVSDYYVHRKETGGAREIVPFEMTWIVKLLGFPQRVAGTVLKTITMEGAPEIDDTYAALLDYGQFSLSLLVDVVSRHATRYLMINGADRQLIWRWEENCVKVYHPDKTRWETFEYVAAEAASGYNKNITEQMYIDEMRCFLEGLTHRRAFVNTLELDHKVLKLLYAIEESWSRKSFVNFEV